MRFTFTLEDWIFILRTWLDESYPLDLGKSHFFFLGALHVQIALGQIIYKCETADVVTFSSQPCAENAQKVRPNSGMSGGVDFFEGEQEIAQSEAPPHEGPIVKTLGGQVRDNKKYLHYRNSPQEPCDLWIDKNGLLVYFTLYRLVCLRAFSPPPRRPM